MCLVVFSASGRGGFVGLAGLGPGFVAWFGFWGVAVEAGGVDGFPCRHRITRMKEEAAEA